MLPHPYDERRVFLPLPLFMWRGMSQAFQPYVTWYFPCFSRCCDKKSCGNRNETPSDPVIIDRSVVCLAGFGAASLGSVQLRRVHCSFAGFSSFARFSGSLGSVVDWVQWLHWIQLLHWVQWLHCGSMVSLAPALMAVMASLLDRHLLAWSVGLPTSRAQACLPDIGIKVMTLEAAF